MYMSASTYFGLGVETTRGTPVAPGYYIPVENPLWTPEPTWLQDKGMKGSPNEVYSNQIGVQHDNFEQKGFAFLDTLPNLIRAVLGSTDTVTGAGPYTHVLGQVNDVANGSQPPSYTLVDFDAGAAGTTTARRITAAQCTELVLTFAAKAEVGYTAKWMGNIAGTVAAPSQSFSNELFVPAWNCALTIGGVTSQVIESADLTINRKVEPIHTIGGASRGPYRLWGAPLEVTGKFSAVWENNADPFAGNTVVSDGTSRAPVIMQFVFTEPTSGHTFTMHMNQVQLKMPKPMRDKPFVRVEATFEAEANTTDVVSNPTSGGYSPMKVTVVNGTSAQY